MAYNAVNNLESFEFACVSQGDVLSAISAIRSSAIGCDNINPKFISILLPHILPFITHLFNTIITTSCYPTKWKHSKIIPIPKSKSEYRPIAILPYLSKVFEKVLHMQMSSHVECHGYLVENQSGFRAKHSCITTLVDVVEDIRCDIDAKRVAIVVLLDHSKAFDTIDHNILGFKLKNFFNFSDTAVRLMNSYLNSRSQSVFSKKSVSVPLTVSRGVPQGSILGPLLFSLYINDLPQHISHCKTHMYADDVQLYLGTTTNLLGDAVSRVNADLRSIYEWANANGLSLNPHKSKCLLFHSKSTILTHDINITINGCKIDRVSSVRNLGITLSDTLSWTNHVNSVVGNIYNKLRALWSSQAFTPLRTRLLLAKTYLMPSLLYGCELFSNCDSISEQKMNVVFNNICRYVYGIGKYDHISNCSLKLYGVSLRNLFNIRLLTLLHKIINSKLPVYLFRRLIFARSNRGKRLISFRYRTLTSEWQFFINVLPLWNSLPNSIQTTCNVFRFKALLLSYFSTSHN